MNNIKINGKYAEMTVVSKKYGTVIVYIDIDDIDRVQQYKWLVAHRNGSLYLTADGGKLLLHRFIMRADKGKVVDHISRNTLDNRKCNLRECTRSQNSMNKKSMSNSGLKNVSWDKDRNKWRVSVKIDGVYKAKRFDDFFEALYYRNQLLFDNHGEFASYGDSFTLFDVDYEKMLELEEQGFHYVRVKGEMYQYILTDSLKEYLNWED